MEVVLRKRATMLAHNLSDYMTELKPWFNKNDCMYEKWVYIRMVTLCIGENKK